MPWRIMDIPNDNRAYGTLKERFTDLVEQATGAQLSAAALKRHLRRRYLEEAAP